MMIYVVIDKATGNEVYRYIADSPIEWVGMEFATHDHVIVPDETVSNSQSIAPTPKILTKLEYLRRFTQEERIAIRQAAAHNAVLDDYLKLLELAQEVNLSDPDAVAAVQMLEAYGLLAPGRAAEILNG
jgi:hypothetical protein